MNVSSYKCCSHSTTEGRQVESLASLLKIVAEPSRLKLVCILRKGKHNVREIMQHVDFSQSLASHHLGDLKSVGIVQAEKRGRNVYYFLTKHGHNVSQALFTIIDSRS